MHRLVVAFCLLLVPACATAQVDTNSIHHRNRCRLAVQVVKTGNPSPHTEWAFFYVTACGGAGAHALASRLRALRASDDTSLVRAATYPMGLLQDRELFEASLEVAGDRTASEVARVFAFRNLVWAVNPAAGLSGFDPWYPTGIGCVGLTLDKDVLQVRPLPPGYRETTREFARRVFRDASESSAIRKSAGCVLVFGGWSADVM
jgi:hypothetical protein